MFVFVSSIAPIMLQIKAKFDKPFVKEFGIQIPQSSKMGKIEKFFCAPLFVTNIVHINIERGTGEWWLLEPLRDIRQGNGKRL